MTDPTHMANPGSTAMAELVPIVIEKTGRGERSYDIFSRLLNDRIIFIGSDINNTVSNLVVAQLLFLHNEDNNADVHLYVNSPGGSVTAGLGIIDTMNYVSNDICTYIIGQAASMGSLIACSGTPGKRFALPFARNLMHQPMISGVMEGQASDLEIEAHEMLRLRDVLYQVYARSTGQDLATITGDCDRNFWLGAEDMKAYGLIDDILEHISDPGASTE